MQGGGVTVLCASGRSGLRPALAGCLPAGSADILLISRGAAYIDY
eukprot:SAG25_NODE_1478_length_2942_cov_11.625747_4_plen_45_part_00